MHQFRSLTMTGHSSRFPIVLRESAADTSARLPPYLTCIEARPETTACKANCQKIQQTAADLKARLEDHQVGRGARLLQVAKAAGISWALARTWPGGRQRERQLKIQGGASCRCLLCGVELRTTPARQEGKTTMRKPPGKSAADAGRRRPDYVIELAVNPDLRDRPRGAAAAQAQTSQTERSKAGEPDPDPQLADREAEP
jgi:hypothetical protein